ncbi:nuclear transport factor 2 family protein [Zooshikella harenae]|uniref:Nuclear transport factor 2 family protein n=1 Tax=Zooshikella harenae TaxID=2827238 RepID=A0ABS5ZG04_9GAMM|nr:nuclear transport factor 2 family protein [Zooshikella harenae]MBU2712999.1 nuclear transport factor 2 family protein [Zooshikella harenae]
MDKNNQFILVLEDQLKQAMLNSDVHILDQLLADDLIFTNHLGQVMSKHDDLKAHKSGHIKIKAISQSEQLIKLHHGIAVVSVLSHIQGDIAGEQSDIMLRFTRVWQKREDDQWQVIAANSCTVDET